MKSRPRDSKDLRFLLIEQTAAFRKAMNALSFSFEKCKRLDVGSHPSEEDLESIEAVTARFARASDVLIRKVLGALDTAELEEPGSILDRIHRAEKRGIAGPANSLEEIRILRNVISHEHAFEKSHEIFKHVLKLTPALMKIAAALDAYLAEHGYER
jgi:hypothetical protein